MRLAGGGRQQDALFLPARLIKELKSSRQGDHRHARIVLVIAVLQGQIQRDAQQTRAVVAALSVAAKPEQVLRQPRGNARPQGHEVVAGDRGPQQAEGGIDRPARHHPRVLGLTAALHRDDPLIGRTCHASEPARHGDESRRRGHREHSQSHAACRNGLRIQATQHGRLRDLDQLLRDIALRLGIQLPLERLKLARAQIGTKNRLKTEGWAGGLEYEALDSLEGIVASSALAAPPGTNRGHQ